MADVRPTTPVRARDPEWLVADALRRLESLPVSEHADETGRAKGTLRHALKMMAEERAHVLAWLDGIVADGDPHSARAAGFAADVIRGRRGME